MSSLAVVCLLTFLHYVGAQMRSPVLPLYAVAHGATATGVGVIVALHMAVSAVGSIPLGRASDVWGRRHLLLVGMAISAVTSLLLPLAEGVAALAVIYGAAGLGVAAFTPGVLSLIGDTAPPAGAGRAYAWYATAHYGAIGVGAFLGGVVAEALGYRAAFIVSAGVVAMGIALAVGGLGEPPRTPAAPPSPALRDISRNRMVWAAWCAAGAGMVTQGVVFTFFPLLAEDRGLTGTAIGLVFLVLGAANTAVRVPAGWLVDRTSRTASHALGGVLVASVLTALLPAVKGLNALLTLVGVFGAASGLAGVALGAALARATTPATRGLAMGGYSACLYLGLAAGSLAVGPVMTRHGYLAGFSAGAAAGLIGAAVSGRGLG